MGDEPSDVIIVSNMYNDSTATCRSSNLLAVGYYGKSFDSAETVTVLSSSWVAILSAGGRIMQESLSARDLSFKFIRR